MGVPDYETKKKDAVSESSPQPLQAPAPKKPSWMPGTGLTNQADSSQGATLGMVRHGEQVLVAFMRLIHSMDSGLRQAMRAIDDPGIDEDEPFLGKLLELAVDAALAGSAEGLAIMAIESIAVHAVEHATAEALEHSESVQETIKSALEGSFKAVKGKRDSGEVRTKELKDEFSRISAAQQSDAIAVFSNNWATIANGMDKLPPSVVGLMVTSLNAIPGDKLDARMELRYLTAWMNFLARAKHGRAKPKTPGDASGYGDQDIDPGGIDTWKTDGSFQRPPKLHGVLEVNLNESGGVVMLDNVGVEARKSLRRLGRPGAFPDLRIGDLKMNMLVRVGKWGESVEELVVGADGTILNRDHPTPHQLNMVVRAQVLRVTNLRRDEADDKHDR